MKVKDKILIQRFLDDELSGKEKAYTEGLIKQDNEASDFFRDLKKIDSLLRDSKVVDEVVDLEDSILESLNTKEHSETLAINMKRIFVPLLPLQGYRIPIAIAAGILIGILISSLVLSPIWDKSELESASKGTFSSYIENSTSVADIDYTGFYGELYLETSDPGVSKIHLDIKEATKTTITFNYDVKDVYLKSFVVHDRRSYPRVITMNDKVRIEFTGSNKFTLVFIKQNKEASDIIFTLRNDLGVQHERKIKI